MLRTVLVLLLTSLVITTCDCGDDPASSNGGNGGNGDPPIDVPAEIDSALWGLWHLYDDGDSVVAYGFIRINEDSIVIAEDSIILTGNPDPDPAFAKAIVAGEGQIYFDPECDGCPNDYRYDYTLWSGDSVMYLVDDSSSTASAPMRTDPGVLILRRDTAWGTTPPLADISDSLVGTWDLYDSTGTSIVKSAHLVINAQSIVRNFVQGGSLTFAGQADPYGQGGYTLVAKEGQIYKDYHWEPYGELYLFDYTLADGGATMYFIDETSATATEPNAETDNVSILKRQ